MNSDKQITEIADLVLDAKSIVVLAGAGLSAESGIPTYRGNEGIWKNYDPMKLATPTAFEEDPKLVWEWYNWKREFMKEAEPNAAYHALKELQDLPDKDFLLITQNIDGLHTRAGITKAIEIHGSVWRLRTHNNPNSDYELVRHKTIENPLIAPPPPDYCEYNYELNLPTPPYIETDDGFEYPLRPDVVWFGENLKQKDLEESFYRSVTADILFVVGTSAVVQPVASIPMSRAINNQEGKTVVINQEITDHSSVADFTLIGEAGKILPAILNEINARS